MPYRVITISSDGTITTTTQPNAPDLRQLEEAVEGYIERLPGFSRLGTLRRGQTFVNEEGRIHGLPINYTATAMWGMQSPKSQPIRGTIIYYARVRQ